MAGSMRGRVGRRMRNRRRTMRSRRRGMRNRRRRRSTSSSRRRRRMRKRRSRRRAAFNAMKAAERNWCSQFRRRHSDRGAALAGSR